MVKKKVGVLRGGRGEDYHSSLLDGGIIISHISENLADKYKTVDILIDQDGVWHLNGLPIVPADLAHKVDLVWNTAHPETSSVLQSFSIPYVGKSIFLATLQNNRGMLTSHLKGLGVKMPRYVLAPKNAREVHQKFPAPWVVRSEGGVIVAKTFPELIQALSGNEDATVEEFIYGTPSSLHTIPNFRGEGVYVMPPGNFHASEKEEIIALAKDLHQHLGSPHYLKVDFTWHPKRGFFLTDISLSPDLRGNSHFHQAAQSVGAKMHHVIEHILERVL